MTAPPSSDVARLRILVVDDDETDRLAVRRCFHLSGVSALLEEAGSGAETLNAIATENYDCILLDYYLPDAPGLSLFQKIKAAAPELPVVMFTGRGDEDIAVELMKSGAADYVPKASLTPERLAAAVRHAMELTRADAARRRAESELKAQENRFRTLANAIPQLAWMTDADGARTWFNQRWLDFTGTVLEEMEGWGWRKVHHPDHVERITELIRRSCATGEPWEDIYPLRAKDGSYRWFLSRALPIRDAQEKIVGWVGTNTDVTDQQNAEVERERLLRLEHEARIKAESAIKARDELLAIVAHDLRNPLQVVLAAASRLATPVSAEERDYFIRTIHRSSYEMNRLIDDLLDLSRLEAGELSIVREPVGVSQALQGVCELFELPARERELTLECEIDPAAEVVYADPYRLSRVVWNLLGNAVKFTPAEGRVWVRANMRSQGVEFEVRDTGPGIEPADLPRVFDRHWQGDRASRSGAGLGLAICKAIVDAHGGCIWIESSPGQGTAVRFLLPRIDGANA